MFLLYKICKFESLVFKKSRLFPTRSENSAQTFWFWSSIFCGKWPEERQIDQVFPFSEPSVRIPVDYFSCGVLKQYACSSVIQSCLGAQPAFECRPQNSTWGGIACLEQGPWSHGMSGQSISVSRFSLVGHWLFGPQIWNQVGGILNRLRCPASATGPAPTWSASRKGMKNVCH